MEKPQPNLVLFSIKHLKSLIKPKCDRCASKLTYPMTVLSECFQMPVQSTVVNLWGTNIRAKIFKKTLLTTIWSMFDVVSKLLKMRKKIFQ